jgi:hypothetical protein
MKRCRSEQKLLPSSKFCSKVNGINVWINMFRVEEDFEIKAGK